MKFFFRKASILVTVGFFIFTIMALKPLWSLPDRLPELSNLMSQMVVDRSGLPLHMPLNRRGDRASSLPLTDIPLSIQRAFILAEDKRYYQHRGVDGQALVRAVGQTLWNMEFVSGASTISMQLVRIHWPQLAGAWAKPAQMFQAMRIEQNHSKAKILDHYLNLVPFAYQVVGVAHACLYFFDKDCSRLSMAETATLAVIPRNPQFYTHNNQALKKSRDFLIQKISGENKSSANFGNQAQKEPVNLQSANLDRHAAHLGSRILREGQHAKQSVIQTTLDRPLQNFLQTLLREQVARHPGLGNTGGILVVHNPTAEVLGYVGSPDFFAESFGMVDSVQALRSPGSALKPFVYAMALEKDWNLASVLPDMPVQFKAQKGIYAPSNYGGGFSGPRQIRYALANSQNLPALYLAFLLGESTVLDNLRKLGFNHLDKTGDHYGVGLVLGNGEVTLWELTEAYSMLARSGWQLPLRYLASSSDETMGQGKKVLSREVAYLIAETLSDPLARSEEFGRGGPLEFDFPVAVKTGTSSDYRDNWTVGFTPDYTVGVWRGNADGSPMRRKMSASQNTGKIFHAVMKHLQERQKPRWFKKPIAVLSRQVCSLSGQVPGPHCNATRQEIFIQGKQPKEVCSLHRSITISNCRGVAKEIKYVDLQDKYLPWANAEGLPTLERQLKEVCGIDQHQFSLAKNNRSPRIIEPVYDAVLALDPTMPRDNQELRILMENTGQVDSVALFIDGRYIADATGKTEIFWKLEKGVHRIQLKSTSKIISEEIEDVVRIQVL